MTAGEVVLRLAHMKPGDVVTWRYVDHCKASPADMIAVGEAAVSQAYRVTAWQDPLTNALNFKRDDDAREQEENPAHAGGG